MNERTADDLKSVQTITSRRVLPGSADGLAEPYLHRHEYSERRHIILPSHDHQELWLQL